MIFTRLLDEIDANPKSVVSVGSFDGLHLAHHQIIDVVVGRARALQGRSVLLTFDPHPREILHPGEPVNYLTSLDERKKMMETLGVDALLAIPFTKEFSNLTSREFIQRYLVRGVGVAEMVEGYNHHFGRNREGGVEEIRSMAAEFGFTSITVPLVNVDDEPVSSSAIRRQLVKGDVDRATRFLGRPYAFSGTVVVGDKRGRQLGFPTANISPEYDKQLLPANGIYVVGVDLEDGVRRFGLANIGTRPTFYQAGPRLLEVYILDFDADIYGNRMTTTFLNRLRNEERFDSKESLIAQMNVDRDQARHYLNVHYSQA